jgi:ABC-type sugar transport system ATPase subunit
VTDNQTNNSELLKMTAITKSFSGVKVLSDVQFELKSGEVHVLAGENGAGKSTLIKILAGVHTDYQGKIILNSQPVRFASIHEAAAAGISAIHQELSLVPSMTVVENIFLGREKCLGPWLDKKDMIKETANLLAEIGLNIDVTKNVESYSLSIRQMVEICKALAFDSHIIIMDEPTSALTDVEVEKLFAIVDKLKKSGRGIIYISHKMEEIYRIADRITVLRDGQYVGTADAGKLTQGQLIKWMVGRELNQQFPRHKSRPGQIRLKIDSFTLADPAGKPAPAVNNVSLSVRSGEILGIAGLQGSGNSELLNGIFGTYGGRFRGSFELDGQRYRPSTPANAISGGISLLTNDRKTNGLVLGMSIVQNITLAALKKFSPCGWLKPNSENQTAF